MKVTSATGRRKNAIAQVRLVPGTGKAIVNKKPFEEYFPLDIFRLTAFKPLEVTGVIGRYDIFASVCGGGLSGQNGAMQLGIARALVEIDEELRGKLRAAGLLTRDPRMVERKKYGQKKARKRFQFSKR